MKEDDFYALGVSDHSAWSKQALLDIIHANWPQLIAPHAIQDSPHMKVQGLRHNYTDEEVAILRSVGINALQQRSDGTIHVGLGGGVTSNVKSMAATLDEIDLVSYLERLQDEISETLEIKISAAGLPADTAICLEWRDDAPFVVCNPLAFETDLTGRLAIPPL